MTSGLSGFQDGFSLSGLRQTSDKAPVALDRYFANLVVLVSVVSDKQGQNRSSKHRTCQGLSSGYAIGLVHADAAGYMFPCKPRFFSSPLLLSKDLVSVMI
jgi:hypothetical protein